MGQDRKPLVWSIAGSDSGGGAGIQADIRALDACGVHACCAIAALTAQNSREVERIEPVSPAMLDAQLRALASDLPPNAIKTGMLGTAENLRVVASWVDRTRAAHPGTDIALVVDPVLAATTGARFADQALVQAYRQELLPRATLITPNRGEAARLLGYEAHHDRHDDDAVERAAHQLRELYGAAVVITGGDTADRGQSARDYIAGPDACGWLALPRIDTRHHHGTGCVFASSAAAALAQEFVEIDATILAKMCTAQALRDGYAAGSGAGPVRPREDFALHRENLPALEFEGHGALGGFAPLIDEQVDLYVIVDSASWVERVLAAGVRCIQLRIKQAAPAQLSSEIRRAVYAARSVGAQLFINDHWALAIEHGAYGVHLGQEDLLHADLEAIRRAGLRLGLSTHSYWEVSRSYALRPSYIACGPLYPTRLKSMPWIPQGEENLAYWCRLLDLPVVGIGGIDVARAQSAMRCGAAGVAVVSAVTGAEQPEAEIKKLAQAVKLGRSERQRVAQHPLPLSAKSTLARRRAAASPPTKAP